MFPVIYTPEPTRPAGGPQPGAKHLLAFGVGEFDALVDLDELGSLGIYNPRDVCGNLWPDWECVGSQHARGAALDVGVPVDRRRWPHGHPEGWRWALFLMRRHRGLGVQEVIFAARRWTNRLGIIPPQEWATYHGRSDHFDHVHSALNAPAAAGLTPAMIRAEWLADREEHDDVTKDELKQALREVLNEAVGEGLLTWEQTVEETLAVVRSTYNRTGLALLRLDGLERVDVAELAEQLEPALQGLVRDLSDDQIGALVDALLAETAGRLRPS